jgi:hypothetical protein
VAPVSDQEECKNNFRLKKHGRKTDGHNRKKSGEKETFLAGDPGKKDQHGQGTRSQSTESQFAPGLNHV